MYLPTFLYICEMFNISACKNEKPGRKRQETFPNSHHARDRRRSVQTDVRRSLTGCQCQVITVLQSPEEMLVHPNHINPSVKRQKWLITTNYFFLDCTPFVLTLPHTSAGRAKICHKIMSVFACAATSIISIL